jgi:hypothetical protein
MSVIPLLIKIMLLCIVHPTYLVDERIVVKLNAASHDQVGNLHHARDTLPASNGHGKIYLV